MPIVGKKPSELDSATTEALKSKLNLGITDTVEEGYYVTDESGNVLMKYDSNGFDAGKVSTNFLAQIQTTSSTVSKWRLKTIAYLGDSITAFAIHVNKYSALTGSVALNYGVGGTRIASSSAGDTTSFVARYSSMSDAADMVIVLGGTNDYGTGNALMGSMSDRVTTTFYGAMHLLCQGLLTKYPKKPIIFMTPLHRGSDDTPRNGLILKDFRNTIIEVCTYYSIPVLDCYAESGIDAVINVNNYFSDGLHPSTVGGYKIASYMYDKLEKFYDEYYVNNK